MADILSPEEIEALLTTLADDAKSEAAAQQPEESTSLASRRKIKSTSNEREVERSSGELVCELYDFRRPDKLSKDQLRKLHMLHETCARAAGSVVSAYLRTPVQVELVSVEQVPYDDYIRGIPHSVFSILSLTPLSGQAVLELEFPLLFTVIDRMLGGPGKAINRQSLTEIERPLCQQFLERIISAIKTAWEPVVVVNPEIEGIENNSQFVQIAAPNDIAVIILFEVRIGNYRGAMSLCVPYLVLKPVTQKLAAQKWMNSATRKRNDDMRTKVATQLMQAGVECSITLGTSEISVAELVSLKAGDLLMLEQKSSDAMQMFVQGQPKYAGTPAMNGNKYNFVVMEKL